MRVVAGGGEVDVCAGVSCTLDCLILLLSAVVVVVALAA